MIREILFRGKAKRDYETSTDHINKGDWVEGYYYYCRINNTDNILTMRSAESGGVSSGLVQMEIEVIPETVGQFTGRKDREGNKIFEHDLVNPSEDGHELNPLLVEMLNGYWSIAPFNAETALKIIGNIFEEGEKEK